MDSNDEKMRSKIKDLFFSTIETKIQCTKCQKEKIFIECNPIIRILPQHYLQQYSHNIFQMESYSHECLSCHSNTTLLNNTHLKISPFILAIQLNNDLKDNEIKVYPENIIPRISVMTSTGNH